MIPDTSQTTLVELLVTLRHTGYFLFTDQARTSVCSDIAVDCDNFCHLLVASDNGFDIFWDLAIHARYIMALCYLVGILQLEHEQHRLWYHEQALSYRVSRVGGIHALLPKVSSQDFYRISLLKKLLKLGDLLYLKF